MIFRLAASAVTLGMLAASALASYAAVRVIGHEPDRAGASIGRLATPVGGEPNFVAPTPPATPAGAAGATPVR